MQLSVKLGLASALTLSGVQVYNATGRVQHEARVFESDMRRDHQTFGGALALAAQTVATHHGLDQAKRVIAATNGVESRRIDFISAREQPRDSDPLPLGMLLGDRAIPELVSYVPAAFVPQGYIRLRESRAVMRAHLRENVLRTVPRILSVLAANVLIIFALGWWMLGKPLRKLVEKVRRVGEGDLSSPLLLGSRDELGVLAQEINAMCERLQHAHRRIREEADARVRAVEQLRHADRLSTVGQLSSGVAHELGTPLSVVAARAKMIATGESDGAEALADARVISDQADRMSRIIRQLLDFARRSSSNRQLEDVRALVQICVEVLSPLAARAGVSCVVQPGPAVSAWVDAGQIQQVVANLVVNAIHAKPASGVVQIAVGMEAERVMISVRDDGEGMGEEVLARIFEPFFTTKGPGKGTGLGLAVARGIVEEHAGTIDVVSAPGQGATLRVLLPAGASS